LLDEIIACMVEDWKERDIPDEHTMTRMACISRRYSNLIIASNAISVLLYTTGTLLKLKSDNQTYSRELFLKMELPFGIESSLIYIAVLITQFVHQTSAASIMAVLNSLLIILVSIIHFPVIRQLSLPRVAKETGFDGENR
jgi:ABC-type transport system involved in cytochrome bd biosynthesis fused ATPase/permease subunit